MILQPEGLDREHLERLRNRRFRRLARAFYLVLVALAVALAWLLCLYATRQPMQHAVACGPDPVFEAKVAHAAEYIAQHNSKVDAEKVGRMHVTASLEARLSPPADYKLLLALALYESTFKLGAVNRTSGAKGLLQLMPSVHDNPMRAAGLDPDDEYDRLLYGALMIAWEQGKGASVYYALRAWRWDGVRDRALNEWRNI